MKRTELSAETIAALNVKLSSIAAFDYGRSASGVAARPATAPSSSAVQKEKSEDCGDPDACPELDLRNIPEKAPPRRADCLIVEKEGWPAYLLFEQGSWALHGAYLDRHNCKPGLRVILAKAETHGPKTTPYTVYVLHIKTAFTVRGLCRRYSEFKDLDRQLRALFATAPTLPKKKTFGKMSPKFISERKRQLQSYIEQVIQDPMCSSSAPVLLFLGARGHKAEEEILLRRHGTATPFVPLFNAWRLPQGSQVQQIIALVEQCRAGRDVAQEGRALNQLAILYSEAGSKAEALECIRRAHQCCRQAADAAGLLACAQTWGCVHAKFGEFDAAEARLREAAGVAREQRSALGEASCRRNLGILRCCRGALRGGADEVAAAGRLYRTGGDLRGAALAEHTLGRLLFSCGEVRQAVEVLEHSLALRRRCRDKLGLAETLHALGLAFADIGYQLHAMDYFEQALALVQEVGDRRGEGACLRELGRVHHAQGDHSEALEALGRGLDLCARRGDAAGQARGHEALAAVHLDLGNAKSAVAHLESALAFFAAPAAAAGGGKQRFPMRFEMKLPGQDMGAHLKFLQSWTLHKPYYAPADTAPPPPPPQAQAQQQQQQT